MLSALAVFLKLSFGHYQIYCSYLQSYELFMSLQGFCSLFGLEVKVLKACIESVQFGGEGFGEEAGIDFFCDVG